MNPKQRVAAMLTVIVGLAVIVRVSGLDETLTPSVLRELVATAGLWGMAQAVTCTRPSGVLRRRWRTRLAGMPS